MITAPPFFSLSSSYRLQIHGKKSLILKEASEVSLPKHSGAYCVLQSCYTPVQSPLTWPRSSELLQTPAFLTQHKGHSKHSHQLNLFRKPALRYWDHDTGLTADIRFCTTIPGNLVSAVFILGEIGTCGCQQSVFAVKLNSASSFRHPPS